MSLSFLYDNKASSMDNDLERWIMTSNVGSVYFFNVNVALGNQSTDHRLTQHGFSSVSHPLKAQVRSHGVAESTSKAIEQMIDGDTPLASSIATMRCLKHALVFKWVFQGLWNSGTRSMA